MSSTIFTTVPYAETGHYIECTTRVEVEHLCELYSFRLEDAFPHVIDFCAKTPVAVYNEGIFNVFRGTIFDSPRTAVLAEEALNEEDLPPVKKQFLLGLFIAFTDSEEAIRKAAFDEYGGCKDLNLFSAGYLRNSVFDEGNGVDLGNTVLGNENLSSEALALGLKFNNDMMTNCLLYNSKASIRWFFDEEQNELCMIMPDGSLPFIEERIMGSPCVDLDMIKAFIDKHDFNISYLLTASFYLPVGLLFSSIKYYLDSKGDKGFTDELDSLVRWLGLVSDKVDLGILVCALLKGGVSDLPIDIVYSVLNELAVDTPFEGDIDAISSLFIADVFECVLDIVAPGETFYDVVCRLSA